MRPNLSLYWWCQILGWGVVIVYWFYYEPFVPDGYALPLLILFAQAASQVVITDQYRRLAHRKGWLRFPIRKLLPIIFLAWLFLTAQYVGMSYGVITLRYGNDLSPGTLLGALAGGSRYHAIWLLAFHLYHFARQSARADADAARHARLATEARLAKLSTELNPHFLFNALNSIKALTREDASRSRQAIDRLSALLRYSLQSSQRDLVPLEEELTIVREYIDLEQIRFEDRLKICWDLPSPLPNLTVLPLSLHCLVENAVKHGIAHLPEGGIISVSLQNLREGWELRVQNNGPFREDNLSGSGLKNLRQRLSLQYGPAATLTLGPLEDHSTIAVLRWPGTSPKH
jgi:signal transduction histidine kinase